MTYALRDLVCKTCSGAFKGLPKRQYCSTGCASKRDSTGIHVKHGQSWSTEYVSWRDMKIRCLNPKKKDYPRYGGRGIKVCEQWMEFENFIADMGMKPGKGYTIERKDHNGDYEPSNCRWATRAEQNRNKCNTYTPEDDRKIRDGVASGLNLKQVAALVGKSHSGVTARTYRLGLRSGQPCKRISP